MKMLANVKKSVANVKEGYANWSSEMKDKVVHFIIDSGKDGDVKSSSK